MKSKKTKTEVNDSDRAFVEFMQLLRQMEEEQKNMTEEEKKNNAVKMGDIWY